MAAAKLILMVVLLALLTFVEQTKSENKCSVNPSSVILCENAKAIIGCPNRKKLHIVYASYGRHTRSICPHHSIHTTSCHASHSLLKVSLRCNGRIACHIHASHLLFGDPCYGTYKYLYVSYVCY
ncbi:L-rhamnose-binding lectin CSL3-like [Stylophora pistillata]|uniref:L-rhamnose-binding lectin CSL3-like n=1 Tax=Stylophora pistillata TaxID=50429 RepID=UPI000C043241|nr:L-rhamnose-binding lectin CSL3-like [Stylophora pistillata]